MEDCCCAHFDISLQYWGSLHGFLNTSVHEALGAAANVPVLLWIVGSGLFNASTAALSSVIIALLAPLNWIIWLLTSNATLIILVVTIIAAWQVYYPSRWTLRLLSHLPHCQGIVFELPPAATEVKESVKPYVALTFNDSPCKHLAEPVLDLLAKHDAKATFFIAGAQVEKMDVLGAGNGHHELGKAMLRRMVAEGHELGNQGWDLSPSHTLDSKVLVQGLLGTHKMLSSARHVALAASDSARRLGLDEDDDGEDEQSYAGSNLTQQMQQRRLYMRQHKWFRPRGGWSTPELVEAAHKHGYTTVLGSVFPWDTLKVPYQPLVNALYICSKVYSGAIIVLHDRRCELLPTLQYVLPWLHYWGYDVVTLGEAANKSCLGQSDLTADALKAHDESLGVQGLFANPKSLGQDPLATADSIGLTGQQSGKGGWGSEYSYGPGSIARQASASELKQLESMMTPADKLKASPAYMAQMANERERAARIAAAEEAERARLKAAKREEADRKAGIDRRLVDMSAAEKRAIERREREKKEAEKRRARRKVEEARARERYQAYVKQKAQDEVERRKAEEAAATKAKQEEERRQKAQEEHKKRQEAERAAAAEMRAKLKAEQEATAAAADATAAAASTVAAFGMIEAHQAWDVQSGSGSVAGDRQKKKPGLFKKLSEKLSSGSSKKGRSNTTESSSLTAAAIAAVGAAEMSSATATAALAAGKDMQFADVTATGTGPGYGSRGYASRVHDETYGWYGLSTGPDSYAALAVINESLAQQKAAIQQSTEAATAMLGGGSSADSIVEHAAAAAGAYAATLPPPVTGRYALGPTGRVLLGFDAQPLLLSKGPEGQVVVLNSRGEALAGPHAEQMALLLGATGTPLVDPYGRPVMVALQPGTGKPLGVHPDGSIIMVPACNAAAAAAMGLCAGSTAAAGPVAAAAVGSFEPVPSSDESPNSIKEADSYAPSLARSSLVSQLSSPAGQSVGAADATGSAAPQLPAMVPAELLLGPNGKPLLGVDNRPLIVAVDEQGVPLVLSPSGGVLLGPDNKPLVLALASDGSLVALDSQCKPLTGADGRPRVVALDRFGRPWVDEDTGRPVLLSLGPNGLPQPESLGASRRVSWAGSASGARLSHSGTHSNLVLAAQPGTGLEVMVGAAADGDKLVGVVDAADYGQYSARSLGVGGDRQLSFSHQKALQQRLEPGNQEDQALLQLGASHGSTVALAPAVNEAYATVWGGSEPAAAADMKAAAWLLKTDAAARTPVECVDTIDAAHGGKNQGLAGAALQSVKLPGLYDQQQLVQLTASGAMALSKPATDVE